MYRPECWGGEPEIDPNPPEVDEELIIDGDVPVSIAPEESHTWNLKKALLDKGGNSLGPSTIDLSLQLYGVVLEGASGKQTTVEAYVGSGDNLFLVAGNGATYLSFTSSDHGTLIFDPLNANWQAHTDKTHLTIKNISTGTLSLTMASLMYFDRGGLL